MTSTLPRDRFERQQLAERVITASRRPLHTLKFDLGVGVVYEGAPLGARYRVDYADIGNRAWEALQSELYGRLCDRRTGQPKAWVGESLEGDVRNLALGIVSAIVTTYDVSLGIGVPAAALILKRGLKKFCASPSMAEPVQFRSLVRRTNVKDARATAVKGGKANSKRLPNKALQPASRARKIAKSKRRSRAARG